MIDLLPRFLRRGTIAYLWPVAVVILATPIGLVVVLMSVKNPTIGTNLVGPMLWFGAIVIGAALGAILWMKALRRRAAERQREKDAKLESEAPQSAMLRKNFEPASSWLLKPMETFPKDAAANLRTNFPGRIAFVPSSITAKLIANVSPPGLLESEEIGNTFNWVELFSICMPLYLLGNYPIRGITTLATGAPLGWLGVINLIIFLIWIPFALIAIFWIVSLLGERFALLKTTRGIVRAGPGWVDHPDGRLWTVEDSVLVIREEWPGKRPGYSVTLLGPTSAFTIQIGKGRSLAFINLWQRWTTPVPRIDLFTARDGDNDRPRGIVLGGLRRMLKFYRHKKLG